MKFTRRQLSVGLGMAAFTPAFLVSCANGKHEKGVLRVALAGGPDSLDPLKAEFAISALLFRQYLLPIVGYGKNGEPSADFSLASSWAPNADFTKWVFEIKPDLKWSDGTILDAQSIVKSLQKGADWKMAYPDASELFGIKGYKKAFLEKADPSSIGVKLLDGNKIEIDLDGADANFTSRMQEFYAVPLHVMDKFGESWTKLDKIVVSGPYKPVVYTQTRIRFEHNPLGGWNDTMPIAIEVQSVDDFTTRIRMFQSKTIDLAQDPSLMRFASLTKDFPKNFIRVKAPRFTYISINTKKPQFTNPLLRRALNMSINRDRIADAIMRGAVNPATRFVRESEKINPDIEAAKKIMGDLGYNATNPLRFELLVPKDERERAAVEIANQWKAIFVEAIITTAESSAISARLNGFDFDCGLIRIDKGMKSDPLDLMASFGEGGNSYSHQWKNSKFDDALNVARSISDEKARLNALLAAEKFLLDEVPLMPIWFADSAWLQADRVSGGIEGMAPIIWPSLKVKD